MLPKIYVRQRPHKQIPGYYEVSCLGVLSVEKPHTFMSRNPRLNRVCPRCAEAAKSMRFGKTYHSQYGGDSS